MSSIACPRGTPAKMCSGQLTLLKNPERYVCTRCSFKFSLDDVEAIRKARWRLANEKKATA